MSAKVPEQSQKTMSVSMSPEDRIVARAVDQVTDWLTLVFIVGLILGLFLGWMS